MALLIVGSIALDTVKTPVEEHADLLGGSASYAALGASFFSPVKLVGIVGDDECALLGLSSDIDEECGRENDRGRDIPHRRTPRSFPSETRRRQCVGNR